MELLKAILQNARERQNYDRMLAHVAERCRAFADSAEARLTGDSKGREVSAGGFGIVERAEASRALDEFATKDAEVIIFDAIFGARTDKARKVFVIIAECDAVPAERDRRVS